MIISELHACNIAMRFLTSSGKGASRVRVCSIAEGWPAGLYHCSGERSVWRLRVGRELNRVGSDEVIVISQVTGKLLAHEMIGE